MSNAKLSRFTSLFTTTLAQTLEENDTTMTLTSTEHLVQGSTVTLTIDRVDANNSATLAQREVVRGVVSDDNIIALERGFDDTTIQAHSTGAIVEMIFTAGDWNIMKDKVNSVDGLITNEVPTGNIDGSNTEFTLSLAPGYRGCNVYRAGVRLSPCSLDQAGNPDTTTGDYWLDGNTLYLVEAPWSNTSLIVDYKLSDNDLASTDTSYEGSSGAISALELQEIRQTLQAVSEQNTQIVATLANIQATQNTQANTLAQIASVEMGLVDDVYALKRAAGTIHDSTNVVETPVGVIDGSNHYFTIAHVPVTGSLKVYRAGLRMTPFKDYEQAPADYTISPNDVKVIKFYVAPESVNLQADYDTTETVTS